MRRLWLLITFFIISFLFVNNPLNSNTDIPTTVLDKKEVVCLARTIYYESRGESLNGQYAVALVVMNRVKSNFAGNICDVVKQGMYSKTKMKCQFNGYCDNIKKTPKEDEAWSTSLYVARNVMIGLEKDFTDGAKYFHTKAVKPKWRHEVQIATNIGNHIFYR